MWKEKTSNEDIKQEKYDCWEQGEVRREIKGRLIRILNKKTWLLRVKWGERRENTGRLMRILKRNGVKWGEKHVQIKDD